MIVLVGRRPPVEALIDQHRQADDRAAMSKEEPRMVEIHPLGELLLRLGLHLDMYQEPLFLSISLPDLGEQIDVATTSGGAARDGLHLLIQELRTTRPVNRLMQVRVCESDEL